MDGHTNGSTSVALPKRRVNSEEPEPQGLGEEKKTMVDSISTITIMGWIEYAGWPAFVFWMSVFWTHTAFESIYQSLVWFALWWALRRSALLQCQRFIVLWVIVGISVCFTLYAFLNNIIVPDVQNKVMVIYCKENMWPPGKITQGIFSAMKHVLGALHYAEQHGAVGVRVHFVDKYYSDPHRGTPNYFAYYFDPLMIVKPDVTPIDISHLEQVHFDMYFKRYGRWGGFNGMIDGETPSTYPLTYGLNRRGVNRLINAYLKLKPEVQSKVNKIHKTHFEGADVVIGVHYRGTDTAAHWPYKKMPYETFYKETEVAIKKLLKEKNLKRKEAKIRIYVATDEAEFLEGMKKQYGKQVVWHDESPRLTPDQYEAATEGLTNSPDVKISNYMKGETAIVDAICLAAGEHLVKGRSNVSEFSYAFNVNMGVTQIFGADDDITYIPRGQY